MPPSASSQPPRRLWKLLRWIVFPLVGLILLVMTLWAAAALYIDCRAESLREPLATLYVIAVLGTWFVVKRRALAVVVTLGWFALVLAWWLTLRPSDTRDWLPEVALLPYAEIEGDRVFVHRIRNCDYRTETDFEVRHYDRIYDLSRLRTADMFMVYWGSPHMAHTMVSFGFENGSYLCFSIETRKEKGEHYSAVKGLFRQFELTYIAADERDLVKLRTNHRKGEDVYLYRLKATPDQVRGFFLSYIQRMNALARQPKWYNAATNNCTLGIRLQRSVSDRAPWDWRMLVNGHLDTLLYARGLIATQLPPAELKQRVLVNPRAQAASPDGDFSRALREGIPVPGP